MLLSTQDTPSNNATVGALAGAVAGALCSLIVSLSVNKWPRWRLHWLLQFVSQPQVGVRTSALICNGYVLPLNSVYAYITIDNETSDVLAPPNEHYAAFITPKNPSKIEEDRLCWAIAGNAPCVDICAGENQKLDVVEITSDWIRIPSEQGWGESRVFLKRKKYTATIKIVCKDIKAKRFRIEIDPANETEPVKLLSAC
jgi:hypothetical protein